MVANHRSHRAKRLEENTVSMSQYATVYARNDGYPLGRFSESIFNILAAGGYSEQNFLFHTTLVPCRIALFIKAAHIRKIVLT